MLGDFKVYSLPRLLVLSWGIRSTILHQSEEVSVPRILEAISAISLLHHDLPGFVSPKYSVPTRPKSAPHSFPQSGSEHDEKGTLKICAK